MGRDKPLDFKLVTRSLTDLQTEGLIKGVLITVPDAQDPSKSRPVEVVIPGDFEPDQEFADFIGKRARGVERISRQTGFQTKKAVTAPAMVAVERLENYKALHQRKREAAEKNLDMQNAMKHNGYLYSKALRARALHLYLWQHVFGTCATAAVDADVNIDERGVDGEKLGLETRTESGDEGRASGMAVEGEAVGPTTNGGGNGNEVHGTEQEETRGAADVTNRARDFDRPVGRVCRPDVYETMQSIRESLARAARGGDVSSGGAHSGRDPQAPRASAEASGPRPGQPAPGDVPDADADVSTVRDPPGGGFDAFGSAAGSDLGQEAPAQVPGRAASEIDNITGSVERPGGRAEESSRPETLVVDPPSSSGVRAGKGRGMRPSVGVPRAALGENLGAAKMVVETVRKLVGEAKADQESTLEKYLRFKVDIGRPSGAAVRIFIHRTGSVVLRRLVRLALRGWLCFQLRRFQMFRAFRQGTLSESNDSIAYPHCSFTLQVLLYRKVCQYNGLKC